LSRALWDLQGKLLNLPVYELLGGRQHERLICYATGGPSNYPQERLGPEVWCVTINLPGHGVERREGEPAGLSSWRYRLEKEDDFVAYFVPRASRVLDHLIIGGTDYRVGTASTSEPSFGPGPAVPSRPE